MSTHRTNPNAGYCALSQRPRGPNGRRLCRRCGTECPKARQSFCSPLCIHEWKVRSNPGYARDCVFKRDLGRCALCPAVGGEWDMDHVVPVVEGGGECGLDGLRSLCRQCHKAETAKLAARLAEKRRREKGAA